MSAAAAVAICDGHAFGATKAAVAAAASCGGGVLCYLVSRRRGRRKAGGSKAPGSPSAAGDKSATPAAAVIDEARFSGMWRSSRSLMGEIDTIKGGTIYWHTGAQSQISCEAPDVFSIDLHGDIIRARLEGGQDGTEQRLVWEDNEVWHRAGKAEVAAMPRADVRRVKNGGMTTVKVKVGVDGGVLRLRWVALQGDVLYLLHAWTTDSTAERSTVADLPRLMERAIHLAAAKATEQPGACLALDSFRNGPRSLRLQFAAQEESELWHRLLTEATGLVEATDRAVERAASRSKTRRDEATPPVTPRGGRFFEPGPGATWPQVCSVGHLTPPRGLSPRGARACVACPPRDLVASYPHLSQQLSQAEEQAQALADFFHWREITSQAQHGGSSHSGRSPRSMQTGAGALPTYNHSATPA
mmetsp:Transcript_119043/g.333495  ORF Transcript_119043/g.333495 Transcript_119043/m.333495 type:complete len:415 (-) Transcript_119043:84-1328(-)